VSPRGNKWPLLHKGSRGLVREGPEKMPSSGGGKTIKEDLAPRPPQNERITVALIPRAGQDLQLLQDRTSLSKTDIVNRAISLYKFIEERSRAGKEVLIRDNETGKMETVLLL
jgi:hypothetical protein